jgi:hypothetical protein
MAAGIQVWDASGNLIFDTTTNLVKWLGRLSVGKSYTGSAQSGSLVVPQFSAYPLNKPFIARMDGLFRTGVYQDQAVFWVDGGTLYWEFPLADPGTNNINRGDQTVAYGLL